MTDAVNKLEKLESGATISLGGASMYGHDSTSIRSIAISLKRIADALDGTALGVDITESLVGLTLQKVNMS